MMHVQDLRLGIGGSAALGRRCRHPLPAALCCWALNTPQRGCQSASEAPHGMHQLLTRA